MVPLPDDVDDVTAVALLMQGVTAHYLATDTFVVQPGDVALVHAAARGVGQLLTQLVKLSQQLQIHPPGQRGSCNCAGPLSVALAQIARFAKDLKVVD